MAVNNTRIILLSLTSGIIAWGLLHVINIVTFAYQKDLTKIPGSWLSRFTNLPLKFQALIGNRNTYIDGLHRKYGPFVRIAPNEISIADISAYREIHKVGTKFRKAPWYQKLSPKQYDDDTCAVFGIRDVRKAATRRKMFQQAGTPAAVVEWEPQIISTIDATVEKIREDLEKRGKADLMKWWYYMTIDVLGTIAFGEDFGMVRTGKKPQLVEDIETSIILVGLKLELPWTWSLVEIIPLPSFRRFVGLFDRFEKYADIAITNTRLAAKGLNKTLFSRMVGPEEEALPETVIRQEAVNIMIAGTDTTAMTLTYLVYAVLRDQTGNIKKRLLDEVATWSAEPTWTELQSKTFLNQLVDETLRLYSPIGGSLPRMVPTEGAVLGKYFIPGEVLVMSQALTFHTDPRIFKDPYKFDPDRWSDASAEMRGYFMPFGGSARSCLGQNFARLEILYAVVKLFRSCPDIRLAANTTDASMKPLEFFAIRPRGGKCEVTL